MSHEMGYESQLLYGPAGATATTLLECRVDVNFEISPEIGDTTCAGDGTAPPKMTGQTTALDKKLSFNMVIKDSAAAAGVIIAAAESGTPIALKFKTFDEDCIISVKQGSPLKGEATIDVNVESLFERVVAA